MCWKAPILLPRGCQGGLKCSNHQVRNLISWELKCFPHLNSIFGWLQEGGFKNHLFRQPELMGVWGENGYMCIYGWVPLLFTYNYHKIVNWLYSNTKLKVQKKIKRNFNNVINFIDNFKNEISAILG